MCPKLNQTAPLTTQYDEGSHVIAREYSRLPTLSETKRP